MSDRPSVEGFNVTRGEAFAAIARVKLEQRLGVFLRAELPLGIGDPPKTLRFDLANSTRRVAVECKALTWKSSGNVPAAKITTLRKALLHL